MIVMRYTVAGVERIYRYDDNLLDEVLARADARFCTPSTPADLERYKRALAIGRGEDRVATPSKGPQRRPRTR